MVIAIPSLLNAVYSKTVEKGNPYKLILIFFGTSLNTAYLD